MYKLNMRKPSRTIILVISCMFLTCFKMVSAQIFVQNSLNRANLYTVSESFSGFYKENQQVLPDHLKNQLQLNLTAHLLADLFQEKPIYLFAPVINKLQNLVLLPPISYFRNDIFKPPKVFA